MVNLRELADAVFRGDTTAARRIAIEAINEGIPPVEILNHGLVAGMRMVGEKFKDSDIMSQK